ncbi:LOW QUALITY PROTEIN: rho GTPase-activating protein 20 [Phascolarctos cinereus]|uniref:Rho GTPase-activating protein 20 n=1 Tax=Phascolarctos cinereus TaxID=38626 RepID=A0A6P5KIP7_PHACI|nr:LOW QUALITY PROTEIN: rho GTPase-activating protein 20 [Phascolarctos cinereus]
MEAMSPQQETLGGQPGRSSSLTGESRIVGDTESKKKMKTLAERRRSAPSLILDKALQKRPSSKESPSANLDPCVFLNSFMGSSRTLLIDGRVELKRGLQRQERHIFLFNDLFVVTKVKYNNNLKIKNKIKLSDMWTASCVDEVGEGNTNTMKSFVLGWPIVNFVATFSSPEQKEKWLSLLQRYIDIEKEKNHPKSIPLKIFPKDIGNCAYSKTITITNSDTVNNVITTALSMLGINGSAEDYQLWVNSGREEAPYPLIGHEYPYGIKMSHLRDTSFLTQGSKDSPSPLDFQESFLMEQLPREMQCQFILKPSRLARSQPLTDPSQKTFKRRRSIINWAFWRGSSTHLDNMPASPTSPMPGQLFGVSLSEICENDNLPKPVLDLLSLLTKKGPLTKGIFRQSGNVKSCRELKEKLNSGAEVDLDGESIFVTACVLKDFLRNIPGSIFSSDLFDEWVCIMDQGNNEEKINRVQRLMEQLPRANVVLLRYLFGMLHSIEQQSVSNQMTAFNLAVCIAPSILWPPSTASPELENEFTKKVSLLVQFLIENCCRIFGEEITSLLRDISLSCDRDNASGISGFQMNDSSYDSLENELNDDVDAPCSDLVKKLGQDSRSMDSVLTLSDCDLDQPESEGILTLSDFDLDQPKNEEIQLKHRSKSKPLSIPVASCSKVSAPDGSKNVPVGTNTLGYFSTAAVDALKNWRRHRRCSEPSIDYLDSKLTYLREFYQKKLRKSSCDAILSHRDEDNHKQPQPSQGGLSLVTQTEVEKKNTANQNVKKKAFFSHEGTPVRLPFKSKPVTISVASYSNISLQDHSKSQTLGPDHSGYSPSNTTLGLRSLQRHRRCSEPNIDYLDCKLTYPRGVSPMNIHKTGCDVGLSLGDEDYLKRHHSLQVEGQKLINQSLIMGIEVGKSNASNQNVEKMLQVTPPRLNVCSRTSYSSLSSPGTSPSGSSVSSQDSAFSQISEHSVFIPTETSSPVDCTFSTLRKQGELSPDFCSPFSGIFSPSPESASSHPLCIKKDNVEWSSQMHSLTLQPSTWLRNGVATLKNWSLKKKTKAPRQERKKANSIKGALEQPTCSSEVSEASLLQERQVAATSNLVSSVETDDLCNPYVCQASEDHGSSLISSVDERLKLHMKPTKEVENNSQCLPGAQPPENPPLGYSLTVGSIVNPAPSAGCPETSVACSDGLGHRTKDI